MYTEWPVRWQQTPCWTMLEEASELNKLPATPSMECDLKKGLISLRVAGLWIPSLAYYADNTGSTTWIQLMRNLWLPPPPPAKTTTTTTTTTKKKHNEKNNITRHNKTIKQTIKQNKTKQTQQPNKQSNKETNKQTNKQTNKETNKQTNKPTSKSGVVVGRCQVDRVPVAQIRLSLDGEQSPLEWMNDAWPVDMGYVQ